jgi:hypothetical protein
MATWLAVRRKKTSLLAAFSTGVSGHAQRRRSTEARTSTRRQAPSRGRSGTCGLLESGRPLASAADQRLPATEH